MSAEKKGSMHSQFSNRQANTTMFCSLSKKRVKKVMLLLSNFIVAVEKSMYGKERERTGKRDYQPFFRANDMEGNI